MPHPSFPRLRGYYSNTKQTGVMGFVPKDIILAVSVGDSVLLHFLLQCLGCCNGLHPRRDYILVMHDQFFVFMSLATSHLIVV